VLTRRQLLHTAAAVTGATGAGVLSACSKPEESAELADGDALRMRVWDDAAASAYRTALAAFTKDTGLEVEVEVLAWDEYWKQVPLDAAAGSLPDVLWMNTANLAQLVDAESLVDVGAVVGKDVSAWETAATDQYRRADTLWGVPQLYDRSVLIANRDLLDPTGADPADLEADPGAKSDSLRDAARAVAGGGASDDGGGSGRIGFSAQPDRSGVLGPFLAGAGGTWQDEDEAFDFASDEGVAVVQYLADMAADGLAPAGAETTTDTAYCRDLFTQGRLALLQTGTYDLAAVSDGVQGTFGWTVHEVVAGTDGARPLVHTVAAVGAVTKDDDRTAAIAKLLTFLGGADAQRPLVEARLGVPAHRDLRSVWSDAWAELKVDVSEIAVLPDAIATPEAGVRSAEGTGAALEIIATIFTGKATAEDALPKAQKAATEAVGQG